MRAPTRASAGPRTISGNHWVQHDELVVAASKGQARQRQRRSDLGLEQGGQQHPVERRRPQGEDAPDSGGKGELSGMKFNDVTDEKRISVSWEQHNI